MRNLDDGDIGRPVGDTVDAAKGKVKCHLADVAFESVARIPAETYSDVILKEGIVVFELVHEAFPDLDGEGQKMGVLMVHLKSNPCVIDAREADVVEFLPDIHEAAADPGLNGKGSNPDYESFLLIGGSKILGNVVKDGHSLVCSPYLHNNNQVR